MMSRARGKISAFVPSVTAASQHCPAMHLSPVELSLSRAHARARSLDRDAASLQPHLLALGHSTRADRRYLIARHKSGMLVIVRHLARDGERATRTAEIRQVENSGDSGCPEFQPSFAIYNESLVISVVFLDCFLVIASSFKFPAFALMCLIHLCKTVLIDI